MKSQTWEAGIHCPEAQAKLLLPQGLGVVAGGGLPEGRVTPVDGRSHGLEYR